jgi:transcriptional regulator with XRE-family HTH domain
MSYLLRDNCEMISLRLIVASNLKKLREANNETQSGFAKKCGMAQRVYGRLENGENWQHLESLDKIARTYDLQVWQLLLPEFNPSNPPLIRKASDKELAFYEKIKDAAKELNTPQ